MGSLRYGTEVDTVWDTTYQRGPPVDTLPKQLEVICFKWFINVERSF